MVNIAGQAQGSAFVPQVAVTDGQKALPDTMTEERMSFTAEDGTVFTANHPIRRVLTPGLIRRYRSDQMEMFWRLIEGLFSDQPDAMDAIDNSWEVMGSLNNMLEPHVERIMKVALGE